MVVVQFSTSNVEVYSHEILEANFRFLNEVLTSCISKQGFSERLPVPYP